MIDWGRVAELRDEVGAENFSEVVCLFLEEADEATQRPLARAVRRPARFPQRAQD